MVNDDFVMYKGTTQPIYISVFGVDRTTPTDLSSASGAVWAAVASPVVASPTVVVEKNELNTNISIVTEPDSASEVMNTLYLEIVPSDFSDTSTGFVTGQYAHEARVIFGTNEYVIYPYPATVPPTYKTFSAIESITRGTEGDHTDSVVRMEPAFLKSDIRKKLWTDENDADNDQ